MGQLVLAVLAAVLLTGCSSEKQGANDAAVRPAVDGYPTDGADGAVAEQRSHEK